MAQLKVDRERHKVYVDYAYRPIKNIYAFEGKHELNFTDMVSGSLEKTKESISEYIDAVIGLLPEGHFTECDYGYVGDSYESGYEYYYKVWRYENDEEYEERIAKEEAEVEKQKKQKAESRKKKQQEEKELYEKLKKKFEG